MSGHYEGFSPFRKEKRDVKSTALGKDDDCGTSGPAHTLLGSRSVPAALTRKKRKQLETNHRENRATGKEGEGDHRRHKHIPRKRRNGGTPVGYSEGIALRKQQYGM